MNNSQHLSVQRRTIRLIEAMFSNIMLDHQKAVTQLKRAMQMSVNQGARSQKCRRPDPDTQCESIGKYTRSPLTYDVT
jgi:hypothetical protein